MPEPSAFQIGTSVVTRYGDGKIVGVEDFTHSDCACGMCIESDPHKCFDFGIVAVKIYVVEVGGQVRRYTEKELELQKITFVLSAIKENYEQKMGSVYHG